MPDFNDLISQAKKMQEKMKETQEALKKIEVEGISGGGTVKVTLNGDGEMVKLSISPNAIKENKEIVEDGVHGFWANTQEEWIEKLEILISDHDRRKRMGMEGRKMVIEHYSLKANAPRMLKIFQQLSSSLHIVLLH